MKTILAHLELTVGMFESEEEFQEFADAVKALANERQKLIQGEAKLLVGTDDINDVPEELRDEVMKQREERMKKDEKPHIPKLDFRDLLNLN